MSRAKSRRDAEGTLDLGKDRLILEGGVDRHGVIDKPDVGAETGNPEVLKLEKQK